MATAAQISANKENSTRSTGPKSRRGKLAVIKNALKHGLSGKRGYVLPHQEQELAEIANLFIDRLQPANDFEGEIVNQAALASFRITRCHRAEAALCKVEFDQLREDNAEEFARVAEETVADVIPLSDVTSPRFRAMMTNPDCIQILLDRIEELVIKLDAGEVLDSSAENSLRLLLRLPKYYKWSHLGDHVALVEHLRGTNDPNCRAFLVDWLKMFHPHLAEMKEINEYRVDSPMVGVLDLFTIGYEPVGWRQIQRYRRDAERLLFNSLALLDRLRAGKATEAEDAFYTGRHETDTRTTTKTTTTRTLSGAADFSEKANATDHVKIVAASAPPASTPREVAPATATTPSPSPAVAPPAPTPPNPTPVTVSPIKLATSAEIGFDSRRRESTTEPQPQQPSTSEKPAKSRSQMKREAAQRRQERKNKRR